MENLNSMNETEFHQPYVLDNEKRPRYTFLGDCKRMEIRFSKEDPLLSLCEEYLSEEDIDLLKSDDISICGGCVLEWASRLGYLDAVQYVVEKGVDIHDNEEIALKLATYFGHTDIVKYLVSKGADIRVGNDAVLVDAAGEGHLEIVEYLIDNGADIHTAKDSPLYFSAVCGHLDVVKYLVSKGADIHARNIIKDLLRKEKYPEVVEYFRLLGSFCE